MADDTQYVKLPDGSYGAFPSSMKDEEITAAVSKNFPPGAPSGLPPVPKPQVDMQPSFLAHAVSAPKQGIESGMSSPAATPENAEAMGTGAAIGSVGGGLVSGGVKAIPAITRSLVGAAGGAGLGHYGGGAIGSIFGPRGREIGSQIGATLGGAGGGLTGGFSGGPKVEPVDPVAAAVKERTASWIPTKMPKAAIPEPELGSPENPGWFTKLPDKMPTPQPQLGSPENPGWNVKLSDRIELPKPQFEPVSNSPNQANQRWMAEQGKAQPITESPNRANAKYLEEQHGDFAKRVTDEEVARQKELASWERFKEQDARSRNARGPEIGDVENPGWNSPLSSRMPTQGIGAEAGTAPSLASSFEQAPEATRYIAEKAAMGHELSPAEEEVLRQHVQSTFMPETSMDVAASKAGRMYAGRGTQFRPTNAQLDMAQRNSRLAPSASQPQIASPEASQGLPQGNQTPFQIASPLEKRDLSLEGRARRAMFEPTASGRTPGQELESTMRQAGNKPPQFSEGQVRQVLTQQGIKDPAWYRQYQEASPRVQGQMIMELVNKMGQR
jgi:hypothetical protein